MLHSRVGAVPDKNGKQSLSHQVHEELLHRLLRNELVPGEILNRRDVARELNVSVAPVLEAMLQLELEGFLESIPRKGTRVRPITAEDVYGQLIVREALECQAARLYCGQKIEENEETLIALGHQVEQTDPGDPEHWKQDIEFHTFLVNLSGCDSLVRFTRSIMRLGEFYRINRFLDAESRAAKQNHEELVTKLKTRDPDEAHKIMKAHIRSDKGHLFNGK